MGYLVSKNFENSGPYEIGTLQEMAKSGKIGEGHWVCKEGDANWIEVTKIPELKSVFAPQPKPGNTPPPKKSPPAKKK